MVNEYFRHVDYGGTLEYYIFELANYCALAFILTILYKLKYINVNSLIIWSGIFLLPIFLNYFLFSPFLFPDQFQYAAEVMSLKSQGTSIPNIAAQDSRILVGDFISLPTNPITMTVSFLGLAPIPNYMTVTSLAFANKFFLFLSFLGLKNFFKDENILLLFFLIPSLLLYSSLSLRETIIIIISVFFLLNMLRDNYLISFGLMLPLLILKVQMFAFFVIYFIGRLIFRANKNLFLLLLYSIIMFISSIVLEESILEIVNYYRIGFAAEDMDLGDGVYGYYAFSLYGDEIAESLTINSLWQLIWVSLIGLPKLLLMPLPGSWSNIFYPIQFAESIFLVWLYAFIAIKNDLLRNKEFIYLSFILLISLMLYSLLVFNEGTFVRYRFTLFFPFVLAAYYIATAKKGDEI